MFNSIYRKMYCSIGGVPNVNKENPSSTDNPYIKVKENMIIKCKIKNAINFRISYPSFVSHFTNHEQKK